jgi:hypothetical protein
MTSLARRLNIAASRLRIWLAGHNECGNKAMYSPAATGSPG